MTVCARCAGRAGLLAVLAGEIQALGLGRWELMGLLDMQERALVAAVGGRGGGSPVDAFGDVALKGGVCRHQDRFPERLGGVLAPPRALFVAGGEDGIGRLGEALAVPVVAVVGSRKSTYYGRDVAFALGRDLARAGVTVVSGLAEGIEASAMHGVLAGGGCPVVAMAGGAAVALPRQHDRLHRSVLERGVAVSELPAGFGAVRAWCFLARARVIAGLADAVVVVEAGLRSGTMLTAELALRAGREVGVVPGRVLDECAAGSNELLRDGAQAVLGAADVLGLVGRGVSSAVDLERMIVEDGQ